jgi:PAS domain S-box-containing protein
LHDLDETVRVQPQAPTIAAQTQGWAIPGEVETALENVAVPTYGIDRFGVIRWLNPAARRLLGDVRGRQVASVVAPEDTLRARESFTRKVLGHERSTVAKVVLLDHDGQRVEVEISSAPLREDERRGRVRDRHAATGDRADAASADHTSPG